MSKTFDLVNLGTLTEENGCIELEQCSDGQFTVGKDEVSQIISTGDKKVEFIGFESHTLAFVNSAMDYTAYYPVHDVKMQKPLQAVLMDLDGTTIRSEEFWIWIIQMTTASLLDNPSFELEEADIPFVSGHSVSEHLQHCIQKYCPDKGVDEARTYYFQHTHHEMNEIMEGRGRPNAFTPSPGIKEFLMKLKEAGVKLGLVTSGLYEKAWPEILDGFKTLGMGDPKDFYDSIITAGFPLRKGSPGTLGELSPKPHPWLYAEVARVGLDIAFKDRNSVIGIEDSGAGVCSIRLGGFPTIGIADGNIIESGTKDLCCHYCENFEEIYEVIK